MRGPSYHNDLLCPYLYGNFGNANKILLSVILIFTLDKQITVLS